MYRRLQVYDRTRTRSKVTKYLLGEEVQAKYLAWKEAQGGRASRSSKLEPFCLVLQHRMGPPWVHQIPDTFYRAMKKAVELFEAYQVWPRFVQCRLDYNSLRILRVGLEAKFEILEQWRAGLNGDLLALVPDWCGQDYWRRPLHIQR